ncbi:Mpo1-like protein [Metabacillus sp. RGM 3146]|uniref:Mpo1-like protein n=1 Tax=Metabacillus sp. RGM 3146 TaxID=3401092 RepID=UPI003B9DABFF
MNFQSYKEFWPFYLSQHSKPATRRWHFAGTSFVFVFFILSIVFLNFWFLLLAPVTAYSIAWISHFFIEGNKPATFGHPLWSLRADFRMYRLMLFGQLGKELNKQNALYEKGKENPHDTPAFRS